jgi:hypothetical protein
MSKKLPSEAAPLDEPEWLFPYEYMLVGESFFIPTMRPAYMGYIIDTTSKKVGIKMKTFTCTENGVLGVRSWRMG